MSVSSERFQRPDARFTITGMQIKPHARRAAAALAGVCALWVGLGGCAGPTESRPGSRPESPPSKSQKREGPAAVAPVRAGTLEISALHWGFSRGLAQNGGYIAAADAASGRELWLLKVYEVVYDPLRERDVQDTFITHIQLEASGLVRVRDELGREYIVDPRSRTVRPR